MAAVLDAFAPYVTKLIRDMEEEEVTKLLGVSGEILKLEDNMQGIRAFIADAETMRITERRVQTWLRKLKDAMYDATDILDLCQLEADKRDPKDGRLEEKVPGCFQRFLFCLLRNPMFTHEIGRRIKKLSQRLDDIHKEADKFKFAINIGSNPPFSRYNYKTTSLIYESAIVGEQIEKDTEELVQELITDDYRNIKVVCISGTFGVGKTTLAQKIFCHTHIQESFQLKIWLRITQHFDEVELMRTAIIQTAEAYKYHSEERDKTLLMRILQDTLSTGHRFLLVMDGLWGEEAWSHVLSIPVKNAAERSPRSRILVTTRLEDLGPRMGVPFYQHHVRPLDIEDAWCLLKKQLPPQLSPYDQFSLLYPHYVQIFYAM